MRGFSGPIEEIILSVSRLSLSELSSRYARSRSKSVSIKIQFWWLKFLNFIKKRFWEKNRLVLGVLPLNSESNLNCHCYGKIYWFRWTNKHYGRLKKEWTHTLLINLDGQIYFYLKKTESTMSIWSSTSVHNPFDLMNLQKKFRQQILSPIFF